MVFCNMDEFIPKLIVNPSHNPYFSRWFSAIKMLKKFKGHKTSHNPYFSRWFSAIDTQKIDGFFECMSQSLF